MSQQAMSFPTVPFVSLSTRAAEIEAWAEGHMVDAQGIIYSLIDKATGQPLSDAFFAGYDAYKLYDFTPAEFYSYENCGMTTGAYQQAMVYRYALTKDPQALQRARRCFAAQKYIFEKGKQLEEGFFPKIYGNRFSPETSTDQVLYTVSAMDHFHPYATDAEKKEIDHIISAMIHFWVRRDYHYDYFAIKNMLWPLARFPMLLLLAYKHSGDELFKKEYERLLAQGVNEQPGEQQLTPKLAGLWPPTPYEAARHAWLLNNMADCTTMDVMELDYLLRHDPQNTWASKWKKSMIQMWDEGKITLAPDGSIYSTVLIDMDTKKIRRPEPQMLKDSLYQDLGEWSFNNYLHGASSGWSTMMARAGVQVHYHHPSAPEIPSTVHHVLSSIGLHDLTYYNEPQRFLPQHRYHTNFISGDALTNWLWAYWQGRAQGMIQEG